MNLLGRVIDFFSPHQAPTNPAPTAATPTRRPNGIQKNRAPNAQQQDARRKRLIQAASRHLEQEVPRPLLSRRRQSDQGGNWEGEVDDTPTQDELVTVVSGDVPGFQVETSQPDEHEIDIDVEDTSEEASPPSLEAFEVEVAEANEPPEEVEDASSDNSSTSTGTSEQWSIRALTDHRRVNGDIEIQVAWDNGESTWEPERNIHLDAPDLLFKYWDDQGDRPLNTEDPDMFDIVAIRAHTKRRFLVEWTGYPPSENSWLPRKEVEATAADVVKEYLEELESGK